MAFENRVAMNSLPRHYGYLVMVWMFLPNILLLFAWLVLSANLAEQIVLTGAPAGLIPSDDGERDLFLSLIRLAAVGEADAQTAPAILVLGSKLADITALLSWLLTALVATICLVGFAFTYRKTKPEYCALQTVEKTIDAILLASAFIATITTLGIFATLLRESFRFFLEIPLTDFLFGDHWSPQTAIRADQVGASGAFGALPLFAGTFLIAAIALLVAGPIGLMTAVYLTQYAGPKIRATVKPLLEILAGVPTVVYGFFAALVVAPTLQSIGSFLSLSVDAESALAAGLVMGAMIIPFVSSLTHDTLMAVPERLSEGSLALGATKSETIVRVILPSAAFGISSAFLLAISRAIGETMIVVMAAGLRPNLTANPLESVTTVTAQIVNLLKGDQEFSSTKTLSAFALGLTLFILTFALNLLAQRYMRRRPAQESLDV